MKTHLIRILSLGVLALGLGPVAVAFPPAPPHTIYGLVRDDYGTPIDVTNAVLTLQTTNNVVVSTHTLPNLEPGVNYRLIVPMDAGLTADTYRTNALRAAVPFKIRMTIGGVTYVPLEMSGDFSKLGKPAQSTRLNLTLGQDSTGDGLPDAWKRVVMAMSGGRYTDISQIHPNDRFPGNPMTLWQAYVAGTYPWDPNDVFALKIVGFNGTNPLLKFTAIRGHAYTLWGSADMKIWVPLRIRLPASASPNAEQDYFEAAEYQETQIEGVQPGGQTVFRFFRAQVQ